MTAKSKTSTATFGFENHPGNLVKLWPTNQPLHHEFLSQSDFDARFEIVPETPTTTTK
jgi:hypothetical protein